MTDDAPSDPVTVVVADDQSAVREGLVLLLGTLPGITVAGEARSAPTMPGSHCPAMSTCTW